MHPPLGNPYPTLLPLPMSSSPELVEAPPLPADHRADHEYESCQTASPSKDLKPKEEQEEEDNKDCFNTPTAEESRLSSAPSTCPPPPRKPSRAVGCKRKLSEIAFFRVEAGDIERLFRPRHADRAPPIKSPSGRRRKLNDDDHDIREEEEEEDDESDASSSLSSL
ncbi:hypothetical protein AXF42_Ash000903 [Apostasia shenzhenica]|uniref:Uncharacterized protein n=1 Tax=Apostasia shenzhenica TaxID=1088818 RepID=A0A2I0ATE4_9ASPA|nr:hypothetical protein AXF42_Ash000903 [Apostasia shenzhenica]